MNRISQLMLKEAGWYPGRSRQTAEYIQAFHQYGVCVPDPVIQFLSEFGGPDIRIPKNGEPLKHRPDSFITEVPEGSTGIRLSRNQIQLEQPDPGWADAICKEHLLDDARSLFTELGLPEVYHIGWTPFSDCCLWMDQDAVVYGGWENTHAYRIGMECTPKMRH